jgi:hypothetical protein
MTLLKELLELTEENKFTIINGELNFDPKYGKLIKTTDLFFVIQTRAGITFVPNSTKTKNLGYILVPYNLKGTYSVHRQNLSTKTINNRSVGETKTQNIDEALEIAKKDLLRQFSKSELNEIPAIQKKSLSELNEIPLTAIQKKSLGDFKKYMNGEAKYIEYTTEPDGVVNARDSNDELLNSWDPKNINDWK